MVATALIMLVCQLPTWWFACPVALIMCREIGVSALREWMAGTAIEDKHDICHLALNCGILLSMF